MKSNGQTFVGMGYAAQVVAEAQKIASLKFSDFAVIRSALGASVEALPNGSIDQILQDADILVTRE